MTTPRNWQSLAVEDFLWSCFDFIPTPAVQPFGAYGWSLEVDLDSPPLESKTNGSAMYKWRCWGKGYSPYYTVSVAS